MAFASIYVPDFSVQAVVRTEHGLRGRALALIEGTPPLEKVVAAGAAALRLGIEPGMKKTQAEDFRGVEIRPRSLAQEKAAHAALLDLGWSVSPRVEDAAPDTIVLDLAGLASLFGPEEEIAHQLTKRASGLGLAVHVAVAANIEAALHASCGFSGITLIPPGEESKRLGPLPVGALRPTEEILETFERWGVRTCAALAALPLLELSERLGRAGVRLHELARGARARSLVLAEPSLHFEEEMELEDSVEELEPLAFVLGRLLDQLCARLAARALAASAIRVRFDLNPCAEAAPFQRRENFAPRNCAKTYEKTMVLPVPMRNSKTLLNLLRLQLQAHPPEAPVQKIFMAAEPARPRTMPGGLFFPSGPDPEKLELTVARIAHLVGDANIGSPELVDTHRAHEFRMKRPAPARDAAPATGHQARAGKTAIGFRLFRPAAPAHVELRDARPARVTLHGKRGEVIAVSGPWRTSGDWWREDRWQCDEWDVQLASGLYRIYYDSIRQGWFARGAYD